MLFNKVIILLAIFVLVVPSLVLAAMSSTNYYIYADSIDFGGGVGTSTSYNLQDSLGGFATGISTSTSYEIRSGYQSAIRGSLSLTLDGNSINFGTLTTAGAVASGNILATVNTDSASGYTLSISGVSGSSLAGVTDGAIDGVGNTEEYGLAVTGVHADYLIDKSIVNGLILSSMVAPASSDTTTLIFKAVRSTGSAAASYSQDITLTAAANI